MPNENSPYVLIVDDEPLLREVAGDMLVDLGYRVDTVADGAAAIRFYGDHADELDLVLLDYSLPDMTGIEVMRAILKINGKAKILVASGYGQSDETDVMLNAGCISFISKPFRASVLAKHVAEAIAAPA